MYALLSLEIVLNSLMCFVIGFVYSDMWNDISGHTWLVTSTGSVIGRRAISPAMLGERNKTGCRVISPAKPGERNRIGRRACRSARFLKEHNCLFYATGLE